MWISKFIYIQIHYELIELQILVKVWNFFTMNFSNPILKIRADFINKLKSSFRFVFSSSIMTQYLTKMYLKFEYDFSYKKITVRLLRFVHSIGKYNERTLNSQHVIKVWISLCILKVK